MMMTQPVKIQQFEDEYNQGITKGTPVTPYKAGTVLKKEDLGKYDMVLNNTQQKAYQLLTAVMLHMMWWSHVEIMNAVRECSHLCRKHAGLIMWRCNVS